MRQPLAALSPATASTTARKNTAVRPWAVIFWLAVWQIAAMTLEAIYPHGALLLPAPVVSLLRLGELVGTAAFWQISAASAGRILGGFLLACLLGTVLAALSARFAPVRDLLAPLLACIKAVPVASFIILALMWLSSRQLSLFISFLMVFPVVYGNVLAGILETDRQLLEMVQIFRVPMTRQLRGMYLPQVMPYFRTACSLGLGLCWKSGIAAEVIGMPEGTIGERLHTVKVYFETADLFAWTLVIVLISVGFEKLFLRLLDAAAERIGASWN